VAISVHNTGSYIPPEHLSRIFERFYQVDPARTRDGRHGGLGLAIAREIVLAHGGSITAHSDPRTGTEFRVLLPVGRRSMAEDGTQPQPAEAVPRGQPVA
jgi:two-component system heavy metal sensor histidine kinase CusS